MRKLQRSSAQSSPSLKMYVPMNASIHYYYYTFVEIGRKKVKVPKKKGRLDRAFELCTASKFGSLHYLIDVLSTRHPGD